MPPDAGDGAPSSEQRVQPVAGSEGSADARADELAAELATAKAERDRAVTALDKHDRKEQRGGIGRRIIVGFLVVLFSILLPITFVVAWSHNIVLNNNGWTRTIGPLASSPAVTSAAAAEITNEVFTALNPQQLVANALPPKASFLAGPVTNAAKGYVEQGVTTALQSQQFQTLWTQAIQFAHAQLLDVLKGNTKAVTTANGQVVLDLVPLFNAALQNLGPFVSGVVGKPVTLPTITASDVPSAACERIGAALNRSVPSTCGQIPLFPADKLTQARRLVKAFDRITVLLLILTPVFAALALWISKRRRRTLLQLTAGGVLGLIVVRRVVIWLEGTLANTGQPQNKAAREAILAQLFHAFFSVSRWILIALVIVFVVALLTGPYSWAHRFREWAGRGAQAGAAIATAVVGRTRDEHTVAWMRAHRDPLRIAGVAVAAILLLAFSVSFIGFLVIAILLVLYEVGLQRVITTPAGDTTAVQQPSDGPPPPGPPEPPASAASPV